MSNALVRPAGSPVVLGLTFFGATGAAQLIVEVAAIALTLLALRALCLGLRKARGEQH